MKWFNRYFVAGIAWIAFVVGIIYSKLGEVLDEPVTVDWWHVVSVVVVSLLPFILGLKSKTTCSHKTE